MANTHNQFSSVEYSRYAAECTRLGRLARNSKTVVKPRPRSEANAPVAEWLRQLWAPSGKLATKLAHR